jgi:hypothetical protein
MKVAHGGGVYFPDNGKRCFKITLIQSSQRISSACRVIRIAAGKTGGWVIFRRLSFLIGYSRDFRLSPMAYEVKASGFANAFKLRKRVREESWDERII